LASYFLHEIKSEINIHNMLEKLRLEQRHIKKCRVSDYIWNTAIRYKE